MKDLTPDQKRLIIYTVITVITTVLSILLGVSYPTPEPTTATLPPFDSNTLTITMQTDTTTWQCTAINQ